MSAFHEGNLRKEDRCANLHRKFDVATIIDHIIKSLLHIRTNTCSIGQDNATVNSTKRENTDLSSHGSSCGNPEVRLWNEMRPESRE
jgi:hypothetical protein